MSARMTRGNSARHTIRTLATTATVLSLWALLVAAEGGACTPVPVQGDPGVPGGGGSGGDGETPTLPYTVVDTGQTLCFDDIGAIDCPTGGDFAGQDAQYEGAPPRYRANGDGTVTDLQTGLMWQQDPGEKMTWAEADAGAASFRLAGYADWRLPTIKELYSLILFSGTDPSGCAEMTCEDMTPFIDDSVFAFSYGDPDAGERVIDAQFATSTLYGSTTMGGNETMFGVNFADGRIKGYPIGPLPGQSEGKLFFVLYVRGNPDYGVNDLVANGDGTVTDRATGLVWLQQDSGHLGAGGLGDGGVDWPEALAWCEGLVYAGRDDWRLPDAKELQSIVDYARAPDTTDSAAIDPLFAATAVVNEAGQRDFPAYWTSTTHAATPGGSTGAYVAFGRAMGYWMNAWTDVHGAGAQRSDPKVGDPADWPNGNGPQGDAIRIYNHARCVAGGATATTGGTAPDDGGSDPTDPPTDPADPPSGPVACDTQADCAAPGACPAAATMGCACVTGPDGSDACIPACVTDADCPSPPDRTLTCDTTGVCVPAAGAGPGLPPR